MRIIKLAQLLTALALTGIAGSALADAPRTDASSETVVVLGEGSGGPACKEASPEHARTLADKAWQDGAYKRAGECYVVAGEHALANEAFVKASAESSGETSRRLASNLNDVKTQARQMKQAFQRR
jgi:hypothetical protein